MDGKRFVNAPRGLSASGMPETEGIWQPESDGKHRPGHMSFRVGVALLLLTAMMWPAAGQNTAPARASISDTLQPSLTQVGQALSGTDPQHWRAPQSVKTAAEGDIEAIQRDLNGTLAGLLQQANGAPGSVPAEFQVYRNVDALYDTLLRVVETADLAAPNQQAAALESALDSLENARTQLGDTILDGAQGQQNELVRLQQAIQAAAVAQRSPTKTTVVNDYGAPAQHHAVRHRPAHPTTHKTPAKPATSGPQKPSNQ